MNLYDILACPICKVHVERNGNQLLCGKCGQKYPIVNQIPVMFPDANVPNIVHESELNILNSYNPWVHRVILQSLLDNQIVLEVGSGNMELDDPNIIKMDVTLTPYVDVVADAHFLPFLPESLDYIFSQAVYEHLRNPFEAAKSMYDSLKDGGYIYHECNFVFAYHGYPHHYFNASLQGMEQIFADFTVLRKGVAPYQMPSFAVEMVLGTYLHYSHLRDYEHGQKIADLFQQTLGLELRQYDIYFNEDEALKVAAGTYFSGMKQKESTSTLIPGIFRDIWFKDTECQARFPNINDLTTTKNILAWGKTEGFLQYPQLKKFLLEVKPFSKKEDSSFLDRGWLTNLPLVEPTFGAIGTSPDASMDEKSRFYLEKNLNNLGKFNQSTLKSGSPTLVQKGLDALRRGGVRRFIGKSLILLGRLILGTK